MRAYLQQSFISTCLILCSIFSQIASASPAIDWVLSTQNADGSYVLSADIATATQSTSEALSAFSALRENTDPGIPLALDYVNSETYLNTENLSRAIYVNKLAGNDVSVLLAERRRRLACSTDTRGTYHSNQVAATLTEAAGYRLV